MVDYQHCSGARLAAAQGHEWLGIAPGPAAAAIAAEQPQFVNDEFDGLLERGVLSHDFLRVCCGDCGHDKLVAVGCKR